MRLSLPLLIVLEAACAFAPALPHRQTAVAFAIQTSQLNAKDGDDDSAPDAAGSDLAAEFFKLAKERKIELEDDELDWDEDEDLDDDEEAPKITDKQIGDEVNERVMETAGGFVEFLKPPSEDEDDDDDEKKDKKPKEYKPPTKIPDADLTAGEVVELILNALKHNDNPTKNKGVEILFAYSSESSQVKQMDDLTPDEYFDYLMEGDYKVLFQNSGVFIEKGEYSPDGGKAFFTARAQTGPKDATPVNFILSTGGRNDNDVWMVDSILIRPPGMRRNRRR